jgi:DNA repair protein RecO (recombination protein O)
MSLVKTLAIVLKSIDWKDTSKIVNFYTRKNGKVDVIAKGARRSNSKYQGVLESINLIEVIIYLSENRQLQILGQATLEKSFPKIRANYEKTTYVFAIFELINIFLQQGASDAIFFDFFTTILDEMENCEIPQIVFWYFILKLTSYLGFRPEFNTCHICSRKIVAEDVVFSVREGTVTCNECISSAGHEWKLGGSIQSFLSNLQKTNHKTLSEKSYEIREEFPYTDFLLTYLRFHSEEKLDLSALKLLK